MEKIFRNEQSKNSNANSADAFSKLRILAEEEINSVASSIQQRPKRFLAIGTTSIVAAFFIGFYAGSRNEFNESMRGVNSTISLVNRQNLTIIRKLETIESEQIKMDERLSALEIQSKARLDSLQNKIEFKEAERKGEEHVKKIERKRGLKKLLPWNWF